VTTAALELLGVKVGIAELRPRIADPVIDAVFMAGRARLTAVRDRALVEIDDVGAFCVENGTSIAITARPDVDRDLLSYWLGGMVLTLLLAQRGSFALHASVVEIDGAAVAICGTSGAGKSTTALRLAQRGHSLVADELSVLSVGDEVMVQPLAHPFRVLPATAARLGLDTSGAWRLPRQRKLVLPAPLAPPLGLDAIVELERGEPREMTSVEVRGPDAHWAVSRHTHRGALLRPLFAAELFAWATAVATTVPVHRIVRPGSEWTFDAVADRVEDITRGVG
jgi:hypothetical protein